MRKKFTMLLASLFLVMGTAWAQVYQKIPHTEWTVTALNQAIVQGNEGGIDYLKDEIPETFYHSDYSNSYSDGTSEKTKGQDGLQAFMVELPEVMSFDKITYKGRSNGPNNWATKARIYVFKTLPDGWPKEGEAVKQLNAMTYTEKEDLLKRTDNTVLGTPAFDNNENGTWAANQNIKTAELASTQQGKFILFVADATTGGNGYLCCGDFHLWQKLEGIVEDKPYFLEIASIEGDWYLDTKTPMNDTQNKRTIGKSETPVPTYFTLNDGYWHISTMPGNEGNYISVDQWCATPQSATAAKWTMVKNDDGSYYLLQNNYGTGSNRFLGGLADNGKVYTNQDKEKAIKIRLVELNEFQTASEAARVLLSHVGVGYPAVDSEARTTLQAAIDAEGATAESINAAIATYQAKTQTVQMPEAGKVYRLVSGVPNFSHKKAIYSNNTEMRWQNRDVNAMNQLWAVLSISGNDITLINVNDGLYPKNLASGASVTVSTVKNECSLEFLGKGQFQIKANKQQGMHANKHGNGSGSTGDIINYNNSNPNTASAWYFEEVAVTQAILNRQIASIENSYLTSLLMKQDGIAGLQAAVDAAKSATENYADAFVNLAKAMNETTTEQIDLGYFYLKSKGAGKYAYNNNTSLKVTDSKSSPKTIFKLTKANDGTFYIQNGNGYYPQNVTKSQNVGTAASALEYTITRLQSGYYALRPTNSLDDFQFWHDANNGTGNIVGWSNDADNTQWAFEALTIEETEKIYTVSELNVGADVYITYNGEGYTGDNVKQAGGFYVLDNAPTTEDFTVNNVGEGMISSVVVDGKSLSVNAGYDGKNIYTLRCMNGDSYARYHSGCQLSANDATNMLTYEGPTYYESLFFIEKGTGDNEGYYTIRSVAAPTMYAYNLGTVDEDSKVAMKEAPAGGVLTDAYYWKISSFGEVAGNITPKGGDAFGWNKRGSYDGKSHIGFWNGGNGTEDNKWFVRLVEEEFVPSLHSVIGYPTKESREEYLSYARFLDLTRFNKLKNPTWDIVLPEAGKFYRIENDNATGFLDASGTTGITQFTAGIGEKASSIFYYTGNKLVSYITGTYLIKDSNSSMLHYTTQVGDAVGTIIGFAKTPVLGKLAISFDNGNRSFYSNGVGPSNGASKGQTGQYYRFTVEEVDMTPIVSELEALAAKATTIAGYTFIAAETKTQLTSAAANATSAANALKNGAFAKDMTAEIAALIETAGYVTTADGFSNNAVYTFLSNRNAEAYMMYDGTNDFVASKYMQTELEVGGENCQWAVYKSGEGNYYLYNLGAQKFMGTETAANTGIPFSEKPQTTELKFKKSDVDTHPIMISSNGGQGTVNHSAESSFTNNHGIVNWDNDFGHPSDPGNVHRVAIVGELDEATLGTIKGLVDAFEKGDILKEFNELVYSARGYAMWMEYGSYNHSVYDYATLCAEIERIDLSVGDGKDATIAQIQKAIEDIEAIIAGFDIKEITPGFYYFVNYDYDDAGEYLSDDISANGNQRALTTEVSAKNIFYYDGQKLIAYASGFGFEYGICNTRTPGKMNNFEFGMAYDPGKYTVISSAGNSEVGYADGYWKNNNGELQRVDAANASGWNIQAVASLPVTITNAQITFDGQQKCVSTLFTPVALEVPAGITAYIGVNEDNYLAMEPIEVAEGKAAAIIPANTGVILMADAADEARTYDFIISETAATAIAAEDNIITGTVAKAIITPENETCYILANDKEDGVGLYKASLNYKNGTKIQEEGVVGDQFLNNACKAYIPVPVAEPQAAKALTMRLGRGTTSIESSELNAQGVQLIYDLQGRRVLNPTKGMYIVNGKKVIVK